MASFLHVVTNFGDLGVLLPMVLVISIWLLAIGRYRLLVWWLIAAFACIGSTGVLKIYFYVCPPIPDLHSPSGHTSLSTLVYGALTLAVATTFVRWRRLAIMLLGAVFILSIDLSRIVLHYHSIIEVLIGSVIGIATLALFGFEFWKHRPTEPRLQALLVTSLVLMVLLNGEDVRAEEFLHAIAIYFHHAGMFCI